ncbi:MAG: LysR family transcriptional regulator [Clostridia bacterium]|nr:LysR family transcriptional regulator [Clostridia bacterium]
MAKNIHTKLTFQIFAEEKAFGPGVASLLTKISELHSLRKAAAEMNMAYSKAWTIIKNCEKQLDMKLLCTSVGGRNGGGAELTENAKKLLANYNEISEQLRDEAQKLFDEKLKWLSEK